jgi:Leucine-rich repeat (LRR) protein
LAFRGVKSEVKTVQCQADRYWDGYRSSTLCKFKTVAFTQDTKLNIERTGLPEVSDEDFDEIKFEGSYSTISLVHLDILAKFPNIKRITVYLINVLNNQDRLENCMNIKHLEFTLKDFTGISNKTFADCRSLESLRIQSNLLTDLPDGLFRSQQNLQDLELAGVKLKLRVNAFEGLQNLSRLRLWSMDLSKTEENFFHKLNIKRLECDLMPELMSELYATYTFPIELIKSHETLEELFLQQAILSQLPENFVPTLRSLKLKTLELRYSEITSAEPFVDLPHVERIYLFGNEIKELPTNSFSGCPKLTHLSLSQNPISSLRGDEFNMLTGLKELNIYGTKLTSIAPNTLHPLKLLEVLDMGSSFEGDEFVIEKELLMHSSNLRELNLSGNNITAIHPESFDNLKRLTSLNLWRNKCVNKWFRAQQNETLDMAMVKKELQECFENYSKQEIKVTCNLVAVDSIYTCFIKNIQVKQNEAIGITANHQAGKSDSDVSSVIFLDSKLHEIPPSVFSKFQNLKEVNVESTELQELNHLENCGTLEALRAPFNNIAAIKDDAFKACNNLRTVDLQSNKIEKLGKNVFKHNEKLREINLARNEINGIEPCGLSNQPVLQSVNLLGNKCISANIHIFNGNFADLEQKLIPCYMSWYSEKLAMAKNNVSSFQNQAKLFK